MQFLTTESLDATSAEMTLWRAVRRALDGEAGYAALRYPIFRPGSAKRHEPDVLLLHPRWGLVILEVKGCRAEHVAGIEGHVWRMQGWHSPTEAPYEQAQTQMWAFLNRCQALGVKLPGCALVALPECTEAEWAERGLDQGLSSPPILFGNQLTPARLRERLESLAGGNPPLDEATWAQACALLTLKPALAGLKAPSRQLLGDSPRLAAIRQAEELLPQLDLEQLQIGMELPPGPQRLRGIAGSGKTLLLAMKVARCHLSHPEWDLAFVFNTRSLYQAVRGHIERFCQHFGQVAPNWDKLQVLHAWGSQDRMGFYRQAAQALGRRPRSLNSVWEAAPQCPRGEEFAWVCQELLEAGEMRPRFDAIFVDEGQDLPPEFYRLAYALLHEPKRLVWAYDEAQSLDHLKVPDSDSLFGRHEDGRLKVDLAGVYPGGLPKSRIMRRCYRTPTAILLPAHALGMGLLRSAGPVQTITTQVGWGDLGYQVESGAFDRPGQEVVVSRPEEHRGHPFDRLGGGPWLESEAFANRRDELQAVAKQMAQLASLGVRPEEMLVVGLGRGAKFLLGDLGDRLTLNGLAWHPADQDADLFRKPGCVTLSGVRRAKGNEAPFVWVLGLDGLAHQEAEVQARNELFVALTRSKGYVKVTGLAQAGAALFEELGRVQALGERLCFVAPNLQALRRRMAAEAEVEQEPEQALPPLLAAMMAPAAKALPLARGEVKRFEKHLPFFARPAAAGAWLAEGEGGEAPDAWLEAPGVGQLRPDMFVLQVQGDSMAPDLLDGSLAVFSKRGVGWQEGQVVLVSRFEDAATGSSLLVKRLGKGADGLWRLLSDNPAYAPLPLQAAGGVRYQLEAKLCCLLGD